MILVKAPMRVSLFGGGSDIPSYSDRFGGATLSFAIDKFVYVAVMRTPRPHIKATYSQTEIVTRVEDLKHDIIRESLRLFKIPSHIEISSFSDIPTIGSGLGGSSAFATALVRGLQGYIDTTPTGDHTMNLAMAAAHIERDRCGSPIGFQDQIAAAYGGMVFTEYYPTGRPDVTRIANDDPFTAHSLHRLMFLVETPPRTTSANDLLSIPVDETHIHTLVAHAREGRRLLEAQDFERLGRLLHRTWEEKQQLHGQVSTPAIDALYARAYHEGALGGKLLGAGGGGYLLIMAGDAMEKYRLQHRVFADCTTLDLTVVPTGADIVYTDHQ